MLNWNSFQEHVISIYFRNDHCMELGLFTVYYIKQSIKVKIGGKPEYFSGHHSYL
jgi:hypothetical protein